MRVTALKVVALTCSALVLSACGGGEGTSQSGSGPAETEQAQAQPLSGKKIDFVVPYGPGGGFDLYVRLIAPRLAEELGADIIVRNEPGAGGITALNTTWNAKPDGTRIQLADTPGAILNELAEQEGARYKIAGFSWLARVAGEPEVVVTRAKDGPSSMEELVKNGSDGLKFASVGVYDSDSIGAQLVGEVFGLKTNVVTGFDGAPEAFTAVLRGDVDAFNVSAGSTQKYVSSGEGRALAVLDVEGAETLADVPPLTEVEGAGSDAEELVKIHGAIVSTGRSVVGPPDMPQEVVDAYRDALEKVLNDPEFLKEAAEQNRVIQYLSGSDVQERVESAAGAPDPRYLELIERAGKNAAR